MNDATNYRCFTTYAAKKKHYAHVKSFMINNNTTPYQQAQVSDKYMLYVDFGVVQPHD